MVVMLVKLPPPTFDRGADGDHCTETGLWFHLRLVSRKNPQTGSVRELFDVHCTQLRTHPSLT